MFAAAQHFEDGDYGSPFRVMGIALGYSPARMVIELDDQTVTTRALMVTIANGAYMGVAMTVAPDARLDDGRFDVRVFRGFSKFELLRHLASIAFGRRRFSPNVSTYRSARVRVKSRKPLPCRADSHDLGTTPLECVSRHAALRVIVGPDFANGQAPTA
jgi:diacylglycerol kinase (ATP)